MSEKKNVGTAVVLNFVLPGAGYMYVGKVVLGVVVLLLALLADFAAISGAGIGVEAAGFLGVVGAIDGYLQATKYNERVDREKAEEEEDNLVRCPECAERIQRTARVCRFCQHRMAA